MRQAEITSANVHDCRLAETLIQGDEQGYFADKAYSGQGLAAANSMRIPRRNALSPNAGRNLPGGRRKPWLDAGRQAGSTQRKLA